jgi:hypothetical protein
MGTVREANGLSVTFKMLSQSSWIIWDLLKVPKSRPRFRPSPSLSLSTICYVLQRTKGGNVIEIVCDEGTIKCCRNHLYVKYDLSTDNGVISFQLISHKYEYLFKMYAIKEQSKLITSVLCKEIWYPNIFLTFHVSRFVNLMWNSNSWAAHAALLQNL